MKLSLLLKTAICGLVVFVTLAAIKEESISSEVALQELVDGNERYVSGKLLHPNRCYARRAETITQQKPFAIILSCSDQY